MCQLPYRIAGEMIIYDDNRILRGEHESAFFIQPKQQLRT